MELIFHKSFYKDLTKFSPKINQQAKARIKLFIQDRSHSLLHFHPLKGEHSGLYSINVTADIRILFYLSGNEMHLTRVGTHNQLYG
jgi:addiction module RelE/StbE family toxin